MEVYTIKVATGTSEYSGTNNYIYVTLVGENGESERTLLDNPGLDFCRGAVSGLMWQWLQVWFVFFNLLLILSSSLYLHQVDEYKVTSPSHLGSLLLVRLEKQRYWLEDNWFCCYVTVEPPGGDTVLTFPCYRWLIGDVKVEIREGTGRKDSMHSESTPNGLLQTDPVELVSGRLFILSSSSYIAMGCRVPFKFLLIA